MTSFCSVKVGKINIFLRVSTKLKNSSVAPVPIIHRPLKYMTANIPFRSIIRLRQITTLSYKCEKNRHRHALRWSSFISLFAFLTRFPIYSRVHLPSLTTSGRLSFIMLIGKQAQISIYRRRRVIDWRRNVAGCKIHFPAEVQLLVHQWAPPILVSPMVGNELRLIK